MKEVFYDGRHATSRKVDHVLILEGLKYAEARLYHLSLFWRMAISSQNIFSSVSLGPHQERLRVLLHDGNPAEPTTYPFFAVIPTISGDIQQDFILQPEWIRIDGHRLYRVVVGGILYFFGVNSAVIRSEWRPALLAKSGTWRLLFSEVRDIPYLDQWFSACAVAERQRESEKQVGGNGGKR
jgi:hypothetical protein